MKLETGYLVVLSRLKMGSKGDFIPLHLSLGVLEPKRARGTDWKVSAVTAVAQPLDPHFPPLWSFHLCFKPTCLQACRIEMTEVFPPCSSYNQQHELLGEATHEPAALECWWQKGSEQLITGWRSLSPACMSLAPLSC